MVSSASGFSLSVLSLSIDSSLVLCLLSLSPYADIAVVVQGQLLNAHEWVLHVCLHLHLMVHDLLLSKHLHLAAIPWFA